MAKRKYFIILLIGFVGWVAETAYFGFNKTPASNIETFFDLVTGGMIVYGLIGDLVTNVEIHKNYYKYKETNIRTKKVYVGGDKPMVNYNFGTTKEETRELLADKPIKE